MARKPRIEYPGAVYHVMCRGDHSEVIFWSDEDRVLFLKTLGEVCEKTGWEVYSYVLMPNHYHFLIKTPEPNLVKGMKWFQGAYTQRFNARNQVYGHLFQGRYKSIPVEGEDPFYFQTVANYIHLNPVRAGLEGADGRLEEYRWSSYSAYLRPSTRPEWLHCENLLAAYQQRDDAKGRAHYKRHMSKRVSETRSQRSSDEEVSEGEKEDEEWCIGSKDFQQRMTEFLDEVIQGKKAESYSGKAKQSHGEARAKELISLAMNSIQLHPCELAHLPKNDIKKQLIAWLIRKKTSVHAEWLTEQLHMGHRVNASRAVARIEGSKEERIIMLKKKMLKCTD